MLSFKRDRDELTRLRADLARASAIEDALRQDNRDLRAELRAERQNTRQSDQQLDGLRATNRELERANAALLAQSQFLCAQFNDANQERVALLRAHVPTSPPARSMAVERPTPVSLAPPEPVTGVGQPITDDFPDAIFEDMGDKLAEQYGIGHTPEGTVSYAGAR